VKRFAWLLLVLTFISAAWGATLKFKNGTQISGTLVSETATSVVVRDTAGVERTFDKSEIQGIDFSESNSGNYNSVPVKPGTSMTVPSGTEMSVRTNDKIDSSEATEGQTFSAVIASDVTGTSGEVLVPKGADANLMLRQLSSGDTTGSPQLILDLQSIKIGGRQYDVSTTDLKESNNKGLGKNKRTATMVGGGAVLGTLLGAIAGWWQGCRYRRGERGGCRRYSSGADQG
jgi:hypothetical protein